ncbi:MAG TPA: carboxypeptidase regulatory-like domain-containing protein, partial [Pyrinomonadaceae bacterium]
MSIRVLIVSIFLVVSLPVAVIAQQNVTSGSLTGRIEDSRGAVISGAKVTATNIETSQRLTTSTDQEGRYRFPYLRTGSYDVNVEAPGFTAVNKHLTITVGQALELPVKLDVAGVSAQVSIGSEVPLIETVRTQVTETIRPREITDLPLNGRNYLDLALLVPGVSPTNTGSNQRFAETSAVPGQGISVAGQRNLYNSFILDGVSANDDAADLAGSYYSEEVIDQFQVVTSGGIAEFGRASGGVVNILTRSGTNHWRGNLYGFFRNQRFDARNPLAPTKDLLTQAQYGLSGGGPLRRQRTFLFTNFEQTRRNYSAVLTIDPAAVNTINNRLRAVNYRGPLIETGVVPASFDTTNFFARVDHRINDDNQLSARYSLYHIKAVNSRTAGGLNAVSRGTGIQDTDQTVQVSNVTTLTTRTVNELRFQYTNSRLDAPVNDEIGPAVNIAGVANFGTATFSPLARDINLVEVVNNVSTQFGSHSLKTGGSFLYNRLNIFFPGAFQGVYNFTSVNNFLDGVYSTYQQAFGAPEQFQSNPNFGVFIQDEWRARRDLTINAGLRYDVQNLPDPIQTDTNNFAPRL